MKTEIPAGEKLTVGLDLGDRRHHACVLGAAGEILAEETIVNTRDVLAAFLARYPGATVVMETGTHSPWVSRAAAALGHPVIVANARKLRAISQSQTKSDREDAQMLARLGRAHSRGRALPFTSVASSRPDLNPPHAATLRAAFLRSAKPCTIT